MKNGCWLVGLVTFASMLLLVQEVLGKCDTRINVFNRPYQEAPLAWLQIANNDELLFAEGAEYAVDLTTDCYGLVYSVRKNGVLVDSAWSNEFFQPCSCTGVRYTISDTGLYVFRAWGQSTSRNLTLRVVGTTHHASISFRCFDVWLHGAMLEGNSYPLMRTGLANSQLIPLFEPFTELGFFEETSGGENISDITQIGSYHQLVDWVRLEVRNFEEPYDIRCATNLLLTEDGHLMRPNGDHMITLNIPPGRYAFTVRPRNHIPIAIGPYFFPSQSSSVELAVANLPFVGIDTRESIDPYTKALRAGNALLETGPQRISYAGANNDRDAILQRIGGVDPIATVSGYYIEDVNMDGVVKYTGANNDRDVVLRAIGGENPIAVVNE